MTIQSQLTPEDLRREGVTTVAEGTWRGAFEFANDEDYFLFQPLPNRRYSITVDSRTDTELGLFRTPELSRLGQDDNSGPGLAPQVFLTTGALPEVLLIEVDAAGTRDPGDEPDDSGALLPAGPPATYALEIIDEGPLDTPDTDPDPVGFLLSTAGGIALGSAIERDIAEPGDLDVYAVWLQAGRDYRADLTGRGDFDGVLEFFDPAGASLTFNDNAVEGTPDARLDLSVPISDFYFFGVTHADLEAGTGDYTLSLGSTGAGFPEDVPDLVGDTPSTGALIEPGTILPGRVDNAGDVDVFALTLYGGARYALVVQGYEGLVPQLTLRGADGTAIATEAASVEEGDLAFVFTPAASGAFFLEVGGSGIGPETGTYDIAAFVDAPFEVYASEARNIALVYEAGLGREADEAGLNAWIDAFDAGAPLVQIAGFFLTSDEFTETVGDIETLSDEELVLGLYENVLERDQDPRVEDPDGFSFWLGAAQNPGVSDAQLLEAFALAPENRAAATESLDRIAFDEDAFLWRFLPEEPDDLLPA